MPPPMLPPTSSASRDSVASGLRSPSPVQTRPQGKGKNAGFRQIGQPNASLKRFFPGDDESEPELSQQRPSPSGHPTQSLTMSTSQNHFISSSRSQELTSIELNVHSHQNGKYIHASRVELHSTQQLGPSQDTRSHIPTPATPSPAAHHPLPPFSMEGQRIASNGTLPMRPMDYDPSLSAQHMPLHLQRQEHTPNMTRPPTPTRSSEVFYSIVSQVGEGTFGKVYKAKNTTSGKFVALKRIRMEAERDGFPVTAMREIKLLQSLRHDNVVQLYEMMVSNGEFPRHTMIRALTHIASRIGVHGVRVHGP